VGRPLCFKGLCKTFAYYDEADIKRGLLATMDLFRKIAMKLTEKLGYSYPIELDKQVTEWTRTRLSEKMIYRGEIQILAIF